jgi:hypothetical protein
MKCGYSSAGALCEDLANRNREQIKAVDLILWRFLADNPEAAGKLTARAQD